MSPRGQRAELLDRLAKFQSGEDRSDAAVGQIAVLAGSDDALPWRDELVFVTNHYSRDDEASGEAALAALASLILDDAARKRPEPRWRRQVPADAKSMSARWADVAGKERSDAVVQGLLGRTRLVDVAFGEHDGRLDLRGFVDPQPEAWGRRLSDLERLDLSGARLGPTLFSERTISNCRFDGAVFADFRMWSTSVTDSSFRGADLSDHLVLSGRASQGLLRRHGRRCEIRRTDFSDANFRRTFVKDAILEDCDLSGARLDRVEFACDLVRCRFGGHLHDMAFYGRGDIGAARPRYIDVDLTAAELHFVRFGGVDLEAFRLPSDGRLRVVAPWPCVRKRIEDRYPEPVERPHVIRFALTQRARDLPAHGKVVFELATLDEEFGSAALVEFERVLDEAEAACRP